MEEINEALGRKEMVCTSKFPVEERSKIHPAAELSESLILKLIDDSNNILKLMPQKPQKLFVYVAPAWTYRLFDKLVQARKSGEKTSETLRKFFQEHAELEKKTVSVAMTRISKSINELGSEFLENYRTAEGFEERGVYEESQRYLGKRLDVVATISGEGDESRYDPKNKAAFTLPFKPALYFE